MEQAQQDLTAIYESMYQPVSRVINEEEEHEEQEFTSRKPKKKKKARGKMDKKMIGAIEQVNSSTDFDNIFGPILEELGEFDDGSDENVFDTEGGDFGDDDLATGGSGDAEQVLQSILDIINDYFGNSGSDEDEFEDDFGGEDDGEFDFDGDLDEEDEIPAESYGFQGGEGNPKGAQGNYDGRARRQAKSTHVKDNGDAKFDQQDTGYDPDDVEGSEGSEHGAQGNYDGRARTQAKTNFVKGNGDADFSKAKTGMKTSSGKKKGNYF